MLQITQALNDIGILLLLTQFCSFIYQEDNRIEALVMSEDLYPLRLPQVLADMKNARWISLKNHPKSSLPTNFQPTKLGCLTLRYGLQKELWQGCKVILILYV